MLEHARHNADEVAVVQAHGIAVVVYRPVQVEGGVGVGGERDVGIAVGIFGVSVEYPQRAFARFILGIVGQSAAVEDCYDACKIQG